MRRASPAEAAALVRREDTLALPLGPGQPVELLRALGERDDWKELRVFTALLTGLYPLFTRPGVRLLSGFFGPVERGLRDAGHDVRFVPGDFRGFERIAQRFAPRVMATCAAPPDANGWLSLSLHAGATADELVRCGRDPGRLLVVETTPRLPRTLGLPPEHPHGVHVDDVDVLVESDWEPLTLADGKPDAVELAIAEHARRFIPDGATLQTGIGEIPNALAEILATSPGGDYGVHSEMFTTGLMHLHLAGKVTNRKGVYDGVSIATFAMGSRELYDWLDGQPAVRFLPVSRVNDPSLIARNRRMISLNGALSVDLAGQIVADAIGRRQHSGIGGHEDFVAGASASPGGHSIVCLPSTAQADGGRVSRILAQLPAGAFVTTPRHHADVIVTEFGAAELAGRTLEERAEALAAIAHPEFRDGLRGA
jgi:acyl-CoA hydrolase